MLRKAVGFLCYAGVLILTGTLGAVSAEDRVPFPVSATRLYVLELHPMRCELPT